MPSVDCLVSARAGENYLNAYFLTHQAICLTDCCACKYPYGHMAWETKHTNQWSLMGQELY